MERLRRTQLSDGYHLPSQLPNHRQVSLVIAPVVNRRFKDHWQTAYRLVVKDRFEPFFPNVAHSDMLVPVQPGPLTALRIIQVNNFEILEPDYVTKLRQSLLDAFLRVKGKTGCVRVGCVETYTDP